VDEPPQYFWTSHPLCYYCYFWPTSVKLIISKFYIIYKLNLFPNRFTISLGYKLYSAEKALILYHRLHATRTIDQNGLTFSFSLLDTWLLCHRGPHAKFFGVGQICSPRPTYIQAIYAGADSCLTAHGFTSHFSRTPPSFPPSPLPFPLHFFLFPFTSLPFPSFPFRSRTLKCRGFGGAL